MTWLTVPVGPRSKKYGRLDGAVTPISGLFDKIQNFLILLLNLK